MMTTTPRAEPAFDSDPDLWQLVCQGSTSAFETLVRRYQSRVCAVAYSACGDLALSEDVAQETFWTAWRQRASLEQPSQLGSWLCGIARNLGKNARRQAARPAESARTLEVAMELPADEPEPAEAAISREEESLVWKALEQIPETYREPLILFYREDQSIAEVAAAMDLSEDAVKQRLSRGRGMLREQVAELVEVGLRRSRPGRKFTVAVMTGLAAHAAGAKTALAGVGAGAWKAAAGAGAPGGALGGLLGSLGGLLGGWLGTWVPAQLAPTRPEREAYLRAGRRILIVSVAFLVALLALIDAFAGRPGYLIAWAAWMVAFEAYIAVECVRLVREVKRIRAQASPAAEPNETALRAGLTTLVGRYRGRVYRSKATLLGWPLLDINVRDPQPPQGTKSLDSSQTDFGSGRGLARGWIAIGDDARGILLALGGNARGFIALGGRAIGVLSFGGLALGLVALGGGAIGLIAIGGGALGGWAFGGWSIGWQAAGGGAIAWDVACGGAAVAWHAASGGAAFAHDYAIGGAARALHANDEMARAVLLNHPLERGMHWYIAHVHWVNSAIIGLSLLIPCAMLPLMYRRARKETD
ncbi:MAG TPA: RNA polymerase sigma factor [Isosphaeraceae bacterium]|nr:RNA polymerase sigma factor [Isosphaeraceae bacterium]